MSGGRPRGSFLHAVKVYTVEQFDIMIDDMNTATIPGYGPFNAMTVTGREFLVGKEKPFIKLTKQTANNVLNISGTPRLATMLKDC